MYTSWYAHDMSMICLWSAHVVRGVCALWEASLHNVGIWVSLHDLRPPRPASGGSARARSFDLGTPIPMKGRRYHEAYHQCTHQISPGSCFGGGNAVSPGRDAVLPRCVAVFRAFVYPYADSGRRNAHQIPLTPCQATGQQGKGSNAKGRRCPGGTDVPRRFRALRESASACPGYLG